MLEKERIPETLVILFVGRVEWRDASGSEGGGELGSQQEKERDIYA